MEDNKPKSGTILRQLRENMGLNQIEASRQSGVSQMTISRYENGQIEKLNMKDMCRLATLYNVTPNYLAQISGWWTPKETNEEEEEPIVRILAEKFSQLPPHKRIELRGMIEMAIAVIDRP